MIKYARIINEQIGLCEVGVGTNTEFYKSIGMNELDVLQSDIDNQWYLLELCPKKTDEEKLMKAKEAKHEENLKKAKYFEQNSLVEYKNCIFETSDSNRGNLRDTSEALEKGLVENVIWLDKNDVQIPVTIEDIIAVRAMILQHINTIWNVSYLKYKHQIEAYTSEKEVNSILIEYN